MRSHTLESLPALPGRFSQGRSCPRAPTRTPLQFLEDSPTTFISLKYHRQHLHPSLLPNKLYSGGSGKNHLKVVSLLLLPLLRQVFGYLMVADALTKVEKRNFNGQPISISNQWPCTIPPLTYIWLYEPALYTYQLYKYQIWGGTCWTLNRNNAVASVRALNHHPHHPRHHCDHHQHLYDLDDDGEEAPVERRESHYMRPYSQQPSLQSPGSPGHCHDNVPIGRELSYETTSHESKEEQQESAKEPSSLKIVFCWTDSCHIVRENTKLPGACGFPMQHKELKHSTKMVPAQKHWARQVPPCQPQGWRWRLQRCSQKNRETSFSLSPPSPSSSTITSLESFTKMWHKWLKQLGFNSLL